MRLFPVTHHLMDASMEISEYAKLKLKGMFICLLNNAKGMS